jgi:hypothetical protein
VICDVVGYKNVVQFSAYYMSATFDLPVSNNDYVIRIAIAVITGLTDV